MGGDGPRLWLVRHVAARHQYRHNDRHVSDGLSHPERAKPDTQALQLKLDELIRVNTEARNSLMGLEEKSESEFRTSNRLC